MGFELVIDLLEDQQRLLEAQIPIYTYPKEKEPFVKQQIAQIKMAIGVLKAQKKKQADVLTNSHRKELEEKFGQ